MVAAATAVIPTGLPKTHSARGIPSDSGRDKHQATGDDCRNIHLQGLANKPPAFKLIILCFAYQENSRNKTA